MSKLFTEGPWLREGTTVYALMHSGYRKGIEQFKNRFSVSVQTDREVTKEEAEATAALISAAPDLLVALVYARRFLRPADHDLEYINAAIAKAMGEQPC